MSYRNILPPRPRAGRQDGLLRNVFDRKLYDP